MNTTQLFASVVCVSSFLLFIVNLPSTYRKLSYGNVYKSCCCMGIRISSLCPNVVLTDCTCEFQSWLRGHRKSAPLQCSRYLPFQVFRTIKPNDLKNSTQWVSFSMFYCLFYGYFWLSFLRYKYYVFCWFYLFVQYEHLIWRLCTCSLTVISSPRTIDRFD